MSAVESLAQTTSGLRQLQLISTLVESEPLDNNGQVGVGALYEGAKNRGAARNSVTHDLEALQNSGWLWFERSAAGIQTVVLKQPGVDAAEEFEALKTNPRFRSRQIRKAVLNWLYDLHVQGGEASRVTDFLTSPSNEHFGERYTADELDRAVELLLDQKYMEAISTFDGGSALPTITSKGIDLVETGETATSSAPGGDIYNIHNSGALNLAPRSTNATQSITMTQGQVKQIEETLESLRLMLSPQFIGVTDEVAAEAQAILGDVDEEIHAEAPSGGKVKDWFMKLVDLAATGTVQAGVNALEAVVQQGINGIG